MRSVNIKYVPAVDQLRGMAATLILFYHGFQFYSHVLRFGPGGISEADHIKTTNPLLALVVEGHSSVAMFMVLSGFIFTYGALDKEISYRRFFTNRLWRIFPLLLFVMVLGATVYQTQYNLLSFLQVLLFQGNFHGAANLGPYTILVWAIGVEFQFYLVFPFLLRFYQRYGVKYLLGVWVVCLIFRMIVHTQPGGVHDVAYYSIIGRMDQFLIGMLCAIIYVRMNLFMDRLKYLFPVGLAATLGWLVEFNQNGGFHWQGDPRVLILWPTADGLAWGLFMLTYLPLARHLPKLFGRVLARAGECSFSVYLLHFPLCLLTIDKQLLLPLATDPLDNALLNTTFLLLPMTYALSALTYSVIEKPFLDMRRSYLQPHAATAPVVASSIPVPAATAAAVATETGSASQVPASPAPVLASAPPVRTE
jgi:peptidoglycan/LPS O-acetylase OafA/YrhL